MANWKYVNRRSNQIGADEALDNGLSLETAPYKPKEVTADSQGRYVGQNGVTVDEMDMVGTGQYINVTDWLQMPDGYSKVTNPYMAATPDQIETRKQGSQVSTGINDLTLMGDDAYNQILKYQQDWANATTDAERAAAHEAAEAIRAQYGYSGGADGSEHLGLMAYTGGLGYDDMGAGDGDGGGYGGGGSGFSYDPYMSKYQARIDALASAILNRDPFTYDKNKDPLYQQYKESYTRGGQRGMQDTLAQVSARTGGLASSYAETAAQQTYNNYMAELANKVPELYQLAYSMYMDDLNQDRADLSMLQGLDDTTYGRWSDALNFDYGMYRDGVSDQQWADQFAYQQSQDALAQQNWQTQFDYQKQQDALAQQNWQTQWDYQVQQDALARQDALNKLVSDTDDDVPVGTTEYTGADDLMFARPEYSGDIDLSDTRGSNYQDINSTLKQMKQGGAPTNEIRRAINEAYNDGLLTETDYQRLINQYR